MSMGSVLRMSWMTCCVRVSCRSAEGRVSLEDDASIKVELCDAMP